MSTSLDNQENICPPSLRGSFANAKNIPLQKADQKVEKPKSSEAKGVGMFGKLLTDASNKVREESDSQLAFEVQTDEACEVVMSWIREETDAKVAEELAKSLDEDEKKQKTIELANGEAAAIKIAVEERKKQKREAKERQEVEKLDAEFAKKCVLEDENELLEKRRILEDDEKYVRDTFSSKDTGDEKGAVAEEKSSFVDRNRTSSTDSSDSKADSKDTSFDSRDCDPKECSADDFKKSSKNSYLEEDFKLACKSQDEENEIGMKKKRQELDDQSYSRKVAMKLAREEHERTNRLDVLSSIVTFPTHKQEAQQWVDAAAQVENVIGGICIKLMLPNLIKLKIQSDNKRKVTIDAHRLKNSDDKEFNRDNSVYMAEFNIRGKDVQVLQKDLTYNYYSETGLLFIYIDRVSLDGQSKEPVDAAPCEEAAAKSSSTLMRTLSGFSRIFNR